MSQQPIHQLIASTTSGKYRSRQQSARSRCSQDPSGLANSHFAQTSRCRASMYGSSCSLWTVCTMLTISGRKRLMMHCASSVRRTFPAPSFSSTQRANTHALIESQYSSSPCAVKEAFPSLSRAAFRCQFIGVIGTGYTPAIYFCSLAKRSSSSRNFGWEILTISPTRCLRFFPWR